MAYVEDRIVHDADSHIMETPDWLDPYLDSRIRERMPRLALSAVRPGEHKLIDDARARHADPDYRAADAEQIMLRKNWSATGSFLKEDRPRALDLLGFATQLVFNTFLNKYLNELEHRDDVEVAYGVAAAHNRAMLDFCSVDSRLLPSCYVPLADFERSARAAGEAIDAGAKALLVASACPARHSPSHVGLFPVWEQAAEAGIPVLFHVGGGGTLVDPMYFENGLPPIPDFHGGEENFRSVDYMAIPNPPMQTLATLIFDGILDRWPNLKFGVIEQGASWLPGWMRSMDSAVAAFAKNEERLRNLSALPSQIVRRQVRVTPYPAEDVGWIVSQTGPEVCLFSSDYPHVEGGRNPIRRFEATLTNLDDPTRNHFYRTNFEDLMGRAMPKPAAA
ncbi:MAG TPA: amidohydrolase family protein [Candidatus Binatia bacterium]|nr:amidohydrolase family protein [Candidatus Binatia bacterium]